MAELLGWLVWCLIVSVIRASDPLVTLSHGGQLRGERFTYGNGHFSLFSGVRYAAPPVGKLRFKKPAAPPSWTGIEDAKSVGNICPQPGTREYNEDCLFLDITVPGDVNPAGKKAVMVWIHGGAYFLGSKDYTSSPSLAVKGDVIVVGVNYRLGTLGFLSDGPGTGNFGLWDQRAALLWVKENIGRFGGDPDLVTIFGQSAGAGSVSAQTMSPHNNGLFKRAIQQSGSMYTEWGWYLSQRERSDIVSTIKQQNKCPSDESVYKCLSQMTVNKTLADVIYADPLLQFWTHPVPDGDFFSSNVSEEDYELSKRFDLMSGFNGQEAVGLVQQLMAKKNVTLSANGTLLEFVKQELRNHCNGSTPMSVELCMEFLDTTYGLSSTSDDKERGRRLSYMLGEAAFNIDSTRQLSIHSQGSKTTYAYYLTELFHPPPEVTPKSWRAPSWLQVSANHGADLPYVYGSVYNRENLDWSVYGAKLSDASLVYLRYINSTDFDKKLTDVVITSWTNFAKSGNPNQPVPLPAGTPAWPQFNINSTQFMELNSANTRVIITPEKKRLESVFNTLFKARKRQVKADKVPASPCTSKKGAETDAVIG